MTEKENQREITEIPQNQPVTARTINREKQEHSRRIFIDPSSPGISTIFRVVVITMVLIFISGFAATIISSLTYLFFLLILSIFFAYLISPLVKLIRKPFKAFGVEKLMPRAASIFISYLIVFTVLGLGISYLAPRVVEQGKEFALSLPSYAQTFRDRTSEINRRFDRLSIPEELQNHISVKATDLGATITGAIGTSVFNLLTYLPWVILIPIISFFFLKDANQFRLAILRMFPAGPWRMRLELVLHDLNRTLAAYTRAQLISCVLIGTICTLGFYFIGLRYALLAGILAGVLEFIPIIGPLAIGLSVTSMGLFSDDPWKGLYIAIFLIVLRLIHDYITYPRIVRDGLHLPPLAIILSVLAGEQVAGIPGVFLSIPIVAILVVFYRHVIEHRGKRGLFAGWIEAEEASMQTVEETGEGTK